MADMSSLRFLCYLMIIGYSNAESQCVQRTRNCLRDQIQQYCTRSCNYHSCLNEGVCLPSSRLDGMTDYACSCSPGWTGARCETPEIFETGILYSYKDTGFAIDGPFELLFSVQACGDAHVALSENLPVSTTYEIVLGAAANTRSYIRRCMLDCYKSTPSTPSILSCSEYKPFWIVWTGAHLSVGEGDDLNNGKFMEYTDDSPYTIRHVSVSTGWGSTGLWTDFVVNSISSIP